MHNIKYWDINTGTIKTAKHDLKDEIQFGDNPSNQLPASKYLMEVFMGSADHTTATAPEHVEIELKDKMSTSPIDILERSLLEVEILSRAQPSSRVRTNNEHT
jgi:hypothetical protein